MDVLSNKGMYLMNIFLLCYKDGESISHILIHCLFVVDVWHAILRDFGMSWVSLPDVNHLLVSWRSLAFTPKGKMLRSMVPIAVWWSVWREIIESWRIILSLLSKCIRKLRICCSFGPEDVKTVIMIIGEG